MIGALKGNFYLVGKEQNIIKAKNQNEKDSVWYRLTLSDQSKTFEITCGEKWKVQVAPDKEVIFDVSSLVLMKEYECSFDIDKDSKGFQKLRLRTFKPISGK